MKNLIPPILRTFVATFTVIFLLTACHKEIKVPAHANKGQNYLYLKIDNTENVIQEGIHFRKNMKGELYGDSESDYKPELSFYELKGVRSCIITCRFRPKNHRTLTHGIIKVYMDYVNDAWVPTIVYLRAFAYSEKHGRFMNIYEMPEREEIQNFHLERLDEEKKIVSFSYQTEYAELEGAMRSEKFKGNVFLYVDFKFGLE